MTFQSCDPPIKDRFAPKLDAKGLAEIEHGPIEVEEINGIIRRAPITEKRFTAIQSVRILCDQHPEQSSG
jgi:hypothetical protein